MSQKDNDVAVVDLTKEVKTGSATKKKSQMRDLSNFFSKIDKDAALAKMESDVKKLSEDAQKKRKLSVSSNEGDDEKSAGKLMFFREIKKSFFFVKLKLLFIFPSN